MIAFFLYVVQQAYVLVRCNKSRKLRRKGNILFPFEDTEIYVYILFCNTYIIYIYFWNICILFSAQVNWNKTSWILIYSEHLHILQRKIFSCCLRILHVPRDTRVSINFLVLCLLFMFVVMLYFSLCISRGKIRLWWICISRISDRYIHSIHLFGNLCSYPCQQYAPFRDRITITRARDFTDITRSDFARGRHVSRVLDCALINHRSSI